MKLVFIELEWMQNLDDLKKSEFRLAGLDEVGRGPLAGPVISGVAYFCGTKKSLLAHLEKLVELKVTDSKKLTTKKRRKIISDIGIDLESLEIGKEIPLKIFNEEISLYLDEASHSEIDQINILQASLTSMARCAHCFADKSDSLMLAFFDGNKIPDQLSSKIKAASLIKGDSKSALIGLASIVAKEFRDFHMEKLAKIYPGYGFEKHAGYPTQQHREAIKSLGVTPIHRKSFKGVKEYL
tara:strand:+ start:4064 stop:4783 length:720 start_codon:yes stop_codon:yes gene_type:complete